MRALGMAALALLFPMLAPAQTGGDGDRDRDLAEAVEAARSGGFSGTILVTQGDRVLVHESMGLADREREIAVTPRTVFDIGSVTKRFTLAGILLLEQEGKLKTADPLRSYLDGVPADKRGITIDHLLNHTSGLGEYHDTQGDFEPVTRDQALDRIWKQTLRFEPGTGEAYSNSGYTVLAAVIEAVSGLSYPEFVRTRLLVPAGMSRTGFYQDDLWNVDEVATGYGDIQHGSPNSPLGWPRIGWALMGNGGLVSSPQDLSRWVRALDGGSILREAARDKMHRRDIDVGPRGATPRLLAYAGGNDFGFQAVVVELLDEGTTIIAAGNDAQGMRAEDVARSLIGILHAGRPAQARVELDIDRSPRGVEGWGFPSSPTGTAAAAILDMILAGTETARDDFIQTRFAPSFRDGFPMAMHREVLSDLQGEIPDPDPYKIETAGPRSAWMLVRSEAAGTVFRIEFEIEESTPHRIVMMGVRDANAGE